MNLKTLLPFLVKYKPVVLPKCKLDSNSISPILPKLQFCPLSAQCPVHQSRDRSHDTHMSGMHAAAPATSNLP